MRYVVLVLSLVGLFACEGSDKVAVGNKTTMLVEAVYDDRVEESVVYDAGTVIKGEVVTAKFKVTNTGSYPLVIASVTPGCSCTVADYPEEPLSPGESGYIMAHVNSDRIGTKIINKGMDITANTTPHITQLVIRGNIVMK